MQRPGESGALHCFSRAPRSSDEDCMTDVLNLVSNLVIVLGYALVPVTWLRHLPLTRPVLVSGVVFFATCAITHVAMAFDIAHHRHWLLVNHISQAVAVMLFVLGFGRLLKRANGFGCDKGTPRHEA